MYLKTFVIAAFVSFQINCYSQNSLAFHSSSLNNKKNNSVNENPSEKENLKTTAGVYHYHMVFLDPLQLLFKQLTVGYEFNHPSDNWAVRVPVTFGISKKYNEYGLDVKFYMTPADTFDREVGPLHPGYATFRYFLGPAAAFIKLNGLGNIAALRFSNGVSWQFVKGLNISAYGSLGPAMFLNDYVDAKISKRKGDFYFDWAINGSVGYRF